MRLTDFPIGFQHFKYAKEYLNEYDGIPEGKKVIIFGIDDQQNVDIFYEFDEDLDIQDEVTRLCYENPESVIYVYQLENEMYFEYFVQIDSNRWYPDANK